MDPGRPRAAASTPDLGPRGLVSHSSANATTIPPPTHRWDVRRLEPAVEDHEALAGSLETLASPVRLRLLEALRRPVRVGQIRVAAPEENGPDRLLSRQAISWHLDQLIEAGLVRKLDAPGRGHLYVLDHRHLFAVVDELHGLTKLKPYAVVEDDRATMDHQADGLATRLAGPRLVLVYGRDEGTTFPLNGASEEAWTIGRDPSCDIPLDYDPFASARHSRIQLDNGHHVVEDLGSSNGTQLNGAPLEPGAPEPLTPGDILIVGRSRLVFQER